jgi:hypothetical protein
MSHAVTHLSRERPAAAIQRLPVWRLLGGPRYKSEEDTVVRVEEDTVVRMEEEDTVVRVEEDCGGTSAAERQHTCCGATNAAERHHT